MTSHTHDNQSPSQAGGQTYNTVSVALSGRSLVDCKDGLNTANLVELFVMASLLRTAELRLFIACAWHLWQPELSPR